MNSKYVIRSKRSDANKNAVKILDAAKKVFAEHGWDTTIEEVAREANVGVGTIYRRFHNKRQLANAVASEVAVEIYEDQINILQSDRLSLVEKVEQAFACYAKITHKYGEIHPIFLELLVTDKGEEDFKETFLDRLHQLHSQIIIKGQEEGILREGDPKLYEIFLQNMINPQMVNQISKIMPLEQTPHFLADLALHGILKK